MRWFVEMAVFVRNPKHKVCEFIHVFISYNSMALSLGGNVKLVKAWGKISMFIIGDGNLLIASQGSNLLVKIIRRACCRPTVLKAIARA